MVSEELLFRGYAFRKAEVLWGAPAALVGSSALFGANHVVGSGYWGAGAFVLFAMHAIASYSVSLADEIEALLDGPRFPVVLGGDCSILIGAALALRRNGRFGHIYLDAHSDCQTPESSMTGGVAGMPLAIATGHGPDLLTGLEGRGPYVAAADAVLIGSRDLSDITGTEEKRVVGMGVRVRDLEDVRLLGPERVATEALDQLGEAGVDGVWVHLDVDALDPEIMPAVDSPDPGGLTADELSRFIGPLLRSPRVRGMQITIYDPERDPTGGAADTIVRVVREVVSAVPRPDA